jgi:hypothetical protein
MPKIWYTTDYYRGGLGDFLCGALGIYHFCRQAGYEFDIYLPAENPLSDCFQVSTERPQVAKQIIMNAELFDGEGVKRRLTKEMRGFPLKVIMVSTNVPTIATEDEMDTVVDDFMKLLRPSAALMDEVQKLQTYLGIETGKYVSIHARCGDAHMTSTTINVADNRMLPTVAAKLVQRFADVMPGPVIVHTDSATLRGAIRTSDQVKVCNTFIQHTGEPIGFHDLRRANIQEIGYLQTVAEFYIMSGAKEIYYITPSGFSRFAALFRGIYAKKVDEALIKEIAHAASVAAALNVVNELEIVKELKETITETVVEDIPDVAAADEPVVPVAAPTKKNKKAVRQ